MTILMSADWFYPCHIGGPSNTIYWQARALTRAGHLVFVVATAQGQQSSIPLDKWLTMDCGQVIYTRNPHFYLPLRHIWQGWRTMRKADIVHLNSLFYPSSLVLAVLARLLGKPVIWSPHGELSPPALDYSPRIKKAVLSLIWLLRKQVLFHATCPAEATYIRQQFGSGATVSEVRNMMDIPIPVARKARPYMLFIGRIHPIKAIDKLIDALGQSALFRLSDYELIIAGPESDPVYARQLREQIRRLNLHQKITFSGLVTGPVKEQFYADALVTILPSKSESFGNVVLESLAQGTPVIASTGTPWEVLEAEQAGSWVSNDADALQREIERYLSMSPELYQHYRSQAAILARQRFDINANVDQWQFVYQAMAA
jgi:glycosyltransferase involved in cell wall biosynthesis